MDPSPEQAAEFQRALLGEYRDAYIASGLTYEAMERATGISRAKLVRLLGGSGLNASLDPKDSYSLARALGLDIVEATRRAEQSVLDEIARPATERD